jgi:hypothetical protein
LERNPFRQLRILDRREVEVPQWRSVETSQLPR